MSPAAAPNPAPARSQVETWAITHLDAAATRWRASADEFEELFSQHRQNISSPGGTEWEGTAKDAALDRVTADSVIVGRHGEIVRSAAALATGGAHDLRSARAKVLEAIAEAEADGFRVAENLSIIDTRRIDIATMADRHTAGTEHAENIRWNAGQLLATDNLISERLTTKAAELNGITFDGEDSRDGTVQFVNNEERQSPKDEAVDRAAEPRNPIPDQPWPPLGTPIEGSTPGGDPYYPDGLGDPVPGAQLPSKPEPPKWTPVDPGAGPFRSWEPRNPGDALAKTTIQAGIGLKEDEVPNAARNLRHYLTVSGEPLQQDVRQMLNDIPGFQRGVDETAQRLGADAINRAQAAGATGPLTFPVNTEWNGMAARQNSVGAEHDWFLASGNFDYNLAGQVTVYPPADPGGQWTYSMDTDVNTRDRYNWDIGKQTQIMGTPITDAQLARLHLIGYAQEFTMVGSTGIHRAG
ncbi:hypothetical protein M2272_005698 [Mycobacterium frederiksbergense]|uniref:Transmembrane protein n=1 Tax=Mycolicibacterium frederiksbergense TaxID=117567 RepID=A0ABT6L7U3_9MYCO|nr:hypothetical protein [Mycolicibacterium frederiksbergense]MDH6199031.1 hypothetical protein [Mycolicibacterium frederiksbergense]